jgi:phosphoglycerate kinase
MLYNLKNIKNANLNEMTVLLRADVDVPLSNGLVSDDSRLNAWLPTLEYLISQNAKVIILGHLGRPKPAVDYQQTIAENQKYSLLPVANWIAQKLQGNVEGAQFGEFVGWKITSNISLLENVRYFTEEEKNDPGFAQKLALLGQVFVSDAFASSHRAHASTEGISHYLPAYAGLRIFEEVEVLSKLLENPTRPLCMILGGAKIETKLPLVEKMHSFADYVLVGGELAENDEVLLKVQHEKIEGQKSALLVGELTEDRKDITPKSIENFLQVAKLCQTIIWNGPVGLVEEENSKQGSLNLAKGLADIDCHKVIGGGDTVAFLKENGLLEKFTYTSIGGGAMLEFLTGEKLPGLAALEEK